MLSLYKMSRKYIDMVSGMNVLQQWSHWWWAYQLNLCHHRFQYFQKWQIRFPTRQQVVEVHARMGIRIEHDEVQYLTSYIYKFERKKNVNIIYWSWWPHPWFFMAIGKFRCQQDWMLMYIWIYLHANTDHRTSKKSP